MMAEPPKPGCPAIQSSTPTFRHCGSRASKAFSRADEILADLDASDHQEIARPRRSLVPPPSSDAHGNDPYGWKLRKRRLQIQRHPRRRADDDVCQPETTRQPGTELKPVRPRDRVGPGERYQIVNRQHEAGRRRLGEWQVKICHTVKQGRLPSAQLGSHLTDHPEGARGTGRRRQGQDPIAHPPGAHFPDQIPAIRADSGARARESRVDHERATPVNIARTCWIC